MALADQHGGLLRTEYGFATGNGAAARDAVERIELADAARPAHALVPAPELPRRDEELDVAREERAAAELRTAQLEAELEAARADRAAAEERARSLEEQLSAVAEMQQLAAASPAPTEPAPATEHTVFSWTPDGYRLERHEGPPPAIGSIVTLCERRVEVLRVGPAPAPGMPVCAYVLG
jgi:hypothetical protein